MPDRREHAFDGICRPQMVPMLGREVEEGEQRFAVLRQAFDRLVVLRVVFLGEDIDRYLGQSAAWRQVNFAQIFLHVRLYRQRDLVQYVRGLMHPAALVPRAGKDLVERLPEAERTVANSDFRSDLQPTLFTSMRSSRQLCALSRTPAWKPMSSFLPSGVAPISTSMHSVVFHAGLQKYTVGPHVKVSSRRQIPLLPGA